MKTLTDTDSMPFGKHKGKPMQDVPASYFHFLWNNGMKNDVATSNVALYIRDNMEGLKQEDEDLIWS